MANQCRETVFRFKQFEIRNEKSGMKVGTDGVLLGAYVPADKRRHILDVGTGTGVIALMLSQRTTANIVGVEIDSIAAEEAKANVISSPWTDRIQIINDDFVNFSEKSVTEGIKFDLIVSNPPYFQSGIKAADTRGIARHTCSLDYSTLVSFSAQLLADDGKLYIISPYETFDKIAFHATLAGLKLICRTDVVTKERRKPIRVITGLSKQSETFRCDVITIQNEDGSYTDEYINLTKEYYLNF